MHLFVWAGNLFCFLNVEAAAIGSRFPNDMGRVLCEVGELGADLGLEMLAFILACSLKLSASLFTFNLIPL